MRFQGLRLTHPTLAAYVGQNVTIRYDPRDVTEVRVYHRGAFVCRAISAAHATEAITLKDLQGARTAHRRALRAQLVTRRAAVAEFLPSHGHHPAGTAATSPAPEVGAARQDTPPRPRLAAYQEDLP